MNWFYRIANNTLNEQVPDINVQYWDSHYSKAGDMVSGLSVNPGTVPNTESISAGINDWHELPGLREVPMSDFGSTKPHDNFYAANDIRQSGELAKEIRNSRQITPLIVGIDDEGPYILEGGHRFVALGELGVASFPALVVIELSH